MQSILRNYLLSLFLPGSIRTKHVVLVVVVVVVISFALCYQSLIRLGSSCSLEIHQIPMLFDPGAWSNILNLGIEAEGIGAL